jgi:hypothetical protein
MLSGLMLHIKVLFVKTPLDKQVYAGLMEIIKDKQYYYQSSVRDYNKFTDEGKEAIVEFMYIMAPFMIEREDQILDQRSKQIMMNVLKK